MFDIIKASISLLTGIALIVGIGIGYCLAFKFIVEFIAKSLYSITTLIRDIIFNKNNQ